EFIEGESIAARQRGGGLPPEQVFDIVDQLAAAIDAVHAAGLIHGDVRPQNVLLEQPSGRVVLLDPSVAVDHELEHRRGTIYGELPYLTLERVRGEPDVPSSDTYALALIAYALLTGKPPWSGDPAEIFAGHEEEAPPPIESRMPGAPPAANEVFAMALAKRPADRPATASALAAALRAVFTGGGTPRPIQPPASRPAPSPLGRSAPSPLGARTPPPEPPDDEPPEDERTIIVRPR
ncbi:MAG TPA: protein kinase, partial [Dehalococcoidia bacterium]|nr:protein kinase [Dehalococcoidia bacterium]